MTDEPHRMLPLCSVCGQRVPLSGVLHDGKAWQCLWHTAVPSAPVNLVVNGVLMPAPEPEKPRRDFYGEVRIVQMDPAPTGLDWSDAQ